MKSTFKYKNRWSRLKGLAIIGVVSGHICHLTLPLMEIFVNYWHLPVFFFIGGYFLKEKHFQAPRKYIGSRFKRLIIPFIIMAIFLAILHNPLLSAGLITGDEYTISSLPAILKKMMLLSVNEYLMGAMWFTPVLFL